MRYFKCFLLAVLAGVAIAIGGAVYLSVSNAVIGSMLFSTGLFTVCTMGLNLYTGKVCYVFENDKFYALSIPVIWLGNYVGTATTALLLRLTRAGLTLATKASTISQVKLNDGLLSIFILAIFCNILIYLGVESYKNNAHPFGKYLGIVFGVMVFILCGFEHCVANMFYFSMAGIFAPKMLLYLLVMTLGNAVGGVFFPVLRKLAKEKES